MDNNNKTELRFKVEKGKHQSSIDNFDFFNKYKALIFEAFPRRSFMFVVTIISIIGVLLALLLNVLFFYTVNDYEFRQSLPEFLRSRVDKLMDVYEGDFLQLKVSNTSDVNTKQFLDNIEPVIEREEEFFSSALNLLIKYPSSFKPFFIEEKRYVSFKIDGNYIDHGFIKVLENIKDEQELIKYYNDLLIGFDQIEFSEIISQTDSGIKRLNVKYNRQFLENNLNENRLVLFKNLQDEKYLIIEFIYLHDSSKYLDHFLYIINHSVYNPENIKNELEIFFGSISEWVFSIKLDQKKWLKTFQSNNLKKFEFNSNFELGKYKNFISTLTIRNLSLLPKQIDPESSIEKEAFARLNNLKSDYEEINVISQITLKKLLDFNFLDFKVSYIDKFTNTKEFLYYGFIQYDEVNFVLFEFRYPGDDSNAYTEFNSLLNSIQAKTLDKKESRLNTSVLGASILKIDKASIIGKPSTVKIFNRTCLDLEFKKNNLLLNASGKKYTYCGGGYGSGFFVSENGILVTNAHVATPNPEDTLLTLLNTDTNKKFIDDLYKDLKSIAGNNFSKLSDADILKLAFYIILKSVDEGILKINATYENYILKHNKEFKISPKDLTLLNLSDVYQTEIIDYKNIPSFRRLIFNQQAPNLGLKYDQNLGNPDLAILKIKDAKVSVPVIKLADPSTILPGSEVIVVGYPGIVEISGLFSSSSISTLTKGTVSAIKNDLTGKYRLVQIDASISSGNSGGPILTNEGDLIGVSTYGITAGGADFNAGVFVDSVAAFLKENNIKNSLGELDLSLGQGINFFNSNRFKLAIERFNYVIQVWPPFSEVLLPLINIANNAINEGKDRSHWRVRYGIQIENFWDIIIFICLPAFVIMLPGIIIVIYLMRSRMKQLNSISLEISNINLPNDLINSQQVKIPKPPRPPIPYT